MTANINQLSPGATHGQLDSLVQGNRLSVRIASTESGTPVAGAKVKINSSSTSKGVIEVVLAAVNEVGLGFLTTNINKNAPLAGEMVQIAVPDFPAMWLEAAATITPGTAVEQATVGGKIQTVNTGKGIGIPLTYGVSGDLVLVALTQPFGLAS